MNAAVKPPVALARSASKVVALVNPVQPQRNVTSRASVKMASAFLDVRMTKTVYLGTAVI